MLGSAEGRLVVDDPFLPEQGSQKSGEVLRLAERQTVTKEVQLVFAEGASQPSDELAAENAAENFDGQQETGACRDPAGMVGRQSAAGHDTVDVRMRFEGLSPGMQNGEEAGSGTEMSWICGHLEQRGCAGFKQKREQSPLVLPDQRHEGVRHAKDEVVIAYGQQFLLPLVEPLLASVDLALGTVPVATRVVRDGLVSTLRALIAMATESSGTATRYGIEDLGLRPGQRRTKAFAESAACLMDHVSHLEGWPAHLFLACCT